MWMYFYRSQRIRDLALAMNPKLEDEIISFIENVDKVSAEVSASTSKFLDLLVSLKAKNKLGKTMKDSQQIKTSVSENMITRTIEKYFNAQ